MEETHSAPFSSESSSVGLRGSPSFSSARQAQQEAGSPLWSTLGDPRNKSRKNIAQGGQCPAGVSPGLAGLRAVSKLGTVPVSTAPGEVKITAGEALAMVTMTAGDGH